MAYAFSNATLLRQQVFMTGVRSMNPLASLDGRKKSNTFAWKVKLFRREEVKVKCLIVGEL